MAEPMASDDEKSDGRSGGSYGSNGSNFYNSLD